MTRLQENIWSAVIGSIASTVMIALLALFTGAWSGKETVTSHNADIVAVRTSVHSEVQRVMDLLCPSYPNAQLCKPGATP